MAYQRKLGRTAAQRKALLRNQVTNLIWYGRIETTLARAKEVRSAAEHLITLAIRECDNTVSVEKTFNNDKGQSVTVTVQNDACPPSDHGVSVRREGAEAGRRVQEGLCRAHQGCEVSLRGEALP